MHSDPSLRYVILLIGVAVVFWCIALGVAERF